MRNIFLFLIMLLKYESLTEFKKSAKKQTTSHKGISFLFGELLDLSDNGRYQNDIIVLTARFNENKRKERQRTGESIEEYNRIIIALLEIINNLEESDFQNIKLLKVENDKIMELEKKAELLSDELRIKNEEGNIQLKELNTLYEREQEESKRLSAKVKSLEEDICRKQKKIKVYQQQNNNLTEAEIKNCLIIKELEVRILELEQQGRTKKELEDKIDILFFDNNKLRNDNAQKNKTIESLRNSEDLLKRQNLVLQKNPVIDTLRTHLNQLSNINKELNHKLEFSSTRIKELINPKSKYFIESISGVSFKMLFIEGGTFTMGNTSIFNVRHDERPSHTVNISSFYISETLVTQELWQVVMQNNPSHFKEDINCPIECISWEDVQRFILELNKITGMKYSLPSEARWEFAAKGGVKSKNYKYSGSNNLLEVGWCNKNSNQKTHPVKKLKPNELGIYDMTGNVWEWCEDNWHDNYSGAPNNGNPWKKNTNLVILRGGSWSGTEDDCRSLYRNRDELNKNATNIGFRLELSSF